MQKIAGGREEALGMARNFAARLVSLIQLDVGLRLGGALLLEFGVPPRHVDAILDLFLIRLMDDLKDSGYFNLSVCSPVPSARGRKDLKQLSRQLRKGAKQLEAAIQRSCGRQARRSG